MLEYILTPGNQAFVNDINRLTVNNDFRVLVFISGRGSNFMALVDKVSAAQFIGCISDNPDAPGLEFAIEAQIPAISFSQDHFASRKEFRRGIFEAAKELNPDLICLAGFMQIIPRYFVEYFYGRMINIHPSLLPKYPGLDTHRRALEDGETKHGVTVHFVDEGMDTGPVIAQASCECLTTDTEETLAARVLIDEHKIYPWVVDGIATGGITLNGREVCYSDQTVKEAGELDYTLGGTQ